MNKKFSRPFKTYQEQINILKDEKGLEIDDQYLANISLNNYSYYTIINGYKDLFLDLDKTNLDTNIEKFKKGTKLSHLYQMHWIDVNMSSIIFKYTLLVEKKLKTRVSYLVAHGFSIDENKYLHEKNYSQASYHKGKLIQLTKEINEKKTRDVSAIHYTEKENNLPPWVAAKAISFGNVVNWYQILRHQHKYQLVSEFLSPLPFTKNKEQLMDYFYRLIEQVYQYRNLSAHGNRIFSIKLESNYELLFSQLKIAKLDKYFDGNPKNGLYSIIFSIFILLDDYYALENFYNELGIFFLTYEELEFDFIDNDIYSLFNLPKDTLKNIKDYLENRFNLELKDYATI